MSKADGGQTALAGYLYQIVAALGMVARADCPDEKEDLQALLTLVREGELLHEYLDQDVVLRTLGIDERDECVFVQFKFSRQAIPPTIGPQELIEIVKQLILSERKANQLDQVVTGYALITNREIGAQSEKIIEAATKNQKHEQIKTIRKTDRYTTITINEQQKVLQDLRLITQLQLFKWQEDLAEFARQYGIQDTEIESGVERLIGKLIRQTANHGFCEVVEADLREALVGDREARPLKSNYLIEYTNQYLNSFSERRLNLQSQPVRRELLDKISEATFERERALVILYGRGGCGKTVALWHWLDERPTGLKMAKGASSVPFLWLTELICDWGNLPPNHARRSESIESALARLQIANPNESPPILYLGLDGLDEHIVHPEQERRVRDILDWFWKEDKSARHTSRPPRATLVVTCRKKEDVTRWLELEQSGFRYRGERPITIEVDDFSEEELLRAAEKGLPQFLARFQASIQEVSPQQEEFMRPMFDTPLFAPLATVGSPTRREEPLIDPDVLSSLRHPAMWRALLELAPQIQRQVLEGKRSAVHQLARVFVLWFAKKAIIRGVSDLEEDDLLWVLKEIACYTKNNVKMIQTNNQWLNPACASQMINGQKAKELQTEALLAGLIERDDRKHWRWRHQLVVDYLVVAELNGG